MARTMASTLTGIGAAIQRQSTTEQAQAGTTGMDEDT